MNAAMQDSIQVNDALHDFVFLDQLAWDFIDTPHFQRLRKLKQLPCLEYVYPCATHTRFEHAIGTAHLAKKFITILIKNSPTAYTKKEPSQKHKQGIEREKVIESAVRTVTIAALLRETGHGPLSDSFELTMKKQDVKWSREVASEQLFGMMIEHLKREGRRGGRKWEGLTGEEEARVRALMRGGPSEERGWEFEIVNNKTNGIDAARLDQFRRDAFYLGAKKIYVDHELLMNEARIIRNEICYPARHIESVYNIFHCRYKLYKDYYFNVTSKAIELMIADLLTLAEPYFRIRDACEELHKNAQPFLRLTDSLLDRVEHALQRLQLKGQKNQQLKKAVDILKCLRERKLYQFVQEITYQIREDEVKDVLKWFDQHLSSEVVEAEVKSRVKSLHGEVEIIVEARDVGFGLENANPMKKVGFFRKERAGRLQRMEENEIEKLSMLYSQAYNERSIKLFLKSRDSSQFEAVGHVLRSFWEEKRSQFRKKFGGGDSYITLGQEGKSPVKTMQQNKHGKPTESIVFQS